MTGGRAGAAQRLALAVVGLGVLTALARPVRCEAADIVLERGTTIVDATLPPPGRIVGDYKPNTLLVADLDGDGRLDFAAANSFDDTVSVFAGDGAGGFAARCTVAVGRRPIGLAAGDWNRDGHLDLAVTSYNRAGATILLGDGAGCFRSLGLLAAGNSPQALVAGDWNGDGLVDLAVSNRNDHTVTIHLGRGGGSFEPAAADGHNVVPVGRFPAGIITGDWNGDGRADLAVVNHYGHSVTCLLGDGLGGFAPRGVTDVGLFPGDIDGADLDGDGRPDLVVVDVRSNDLAVLHGLGDGTFRISARLPAGAAPAGMAIVDLDHDGHDDLVVVMRDAPELVVYRSEPGSTEGFRRVATVATGANPIDVAPGDFDRDGRPDLLVSMPGDDAFAVFLNRTPGTGAAGWTRE